MNWEFTPFDPLVWMIFAAFWVAVVVIVRAFHRRYPDYPRGVDAVVDETIEQLPEHPADKARGEPLPLQGNAESKQVPIQP